MTMKIEHLPIGTPLFDGRRKVGYINMSGWYVITRITHSNGVRYGYLKGFHGLKIILPTKGVCHVDC